MLLEKIIRMIQAKEINFLLKIKYYLVVIKLIKLNIFLMKLIYILN